MPELNQDLILTVAGGKGGTGKSILAVNLGLALAARGTRTLLADLDLGGSNLHTLLGQKNLRPGLGRLLVDSSLQVKQLIHPSPWPQLSYLPGDNQVPKAANPLTTQKQKIIRGLRNSGFEIILGDIGAGASLTTLDFFLISPQGLIVLIPELTSLLNAYAFLRHALYRGLWMVLRDNLYASRVLEAYRASPLGSEAWTIERLMEETAKAAPGQERRIRRVLGWWRPGLVMNQVKYREDLSFGEQLRRLAREKLSVNLIPLAALPFDPAVQESLRARQPVLCAEPESPFSREVGHLAERLAAWEPVPAEELEARVAGWGLGRRPEAAPAAPAAPPEEEASRILVEMLPVVDDLSRALAEARKSGQEAMAEGLAAILKGHLDRLAGHDIKPIETSGRQFNPHYHQAVAMDKDSGRAKGFIIAEVAKGFTRRDRLIRPAKVVVAG